MNLRFFKKCKKLRFLKFEKSSNFLSKNSKLSVSFDLRFIREIQAWFFFYKIVYLIILPLPNTVLIPDKMCGERLGGYTPRGLSDLFIHSVI